MRASIEHEIREHITVAQSLSSMLPEIILAAEMCQDTLTEGHRIFLAGNGGSAADAQHIAAEFVGRFQKERMSLPAYALTTNGSTLTAIANDYSFEEVFSRQIEGLGRAGDLFIGISTSGNSENVVRACKSAREKGLKVITLTGQSGGLLREQSDICLRVQSHLTARIQEMHILIGHLLCKCVDEKYK